MEIKHGDWQEAKEAVTADFATSKTKSAKVPTKEVGVEHLRMDGLGFDAPPIDAEKIFYLQDNVYADGTIRKLTRLLFQSKDKFNIEAIKTKTGQKDDKLSAKFMQMAERLEVDVWSQMERQLNDYYYWSPYIANQVWGQDKESGESDVQLLSITHLHPYTFKTAPSNSGGKVYNNILQGITINDKNELEFWQEPAPNETPKILPTESIFCAFDPASYGIVGRPMILPIIPVINMLSFGWKTEMRHMNRVGAGGNLLIQVNQPKAAGIGGRSISDIAHLNNLVKNWNNNTAGIIFENMTPMDPKTKHDTNNLESISALTNVLTEYITLSAYMSSGQTTKLGGNDASLKELLDNSIISMQQKIAAPWERLFAQYFKFNGFAPGEYKVKFHIPEPSHNDRDMNRKMADSGYLAQDMTVNERRELRGLKPLSEQELKDLAKDFADRTKSEQLIKPQ